eukprot:15484480-Alexandrium_andersonii.AAC.1
MCIRDRWPTRPVGKGGPCPQRHAEAPAEPHPSVDLRARAFRPSDLAAQHPTLLWRSSAPEVWRPSGGGCEAGPQSATRIVPLWGPSI